MTWLQTCSSPKYGDEAEDRVRERRAWRVLGIADRHGQCGFGAFHGIEHGDRVGREFGCAIEWSIGIDRRVAFVRRHEVVEIVLGIEPIANGHDEVTFDADRTCR